MRGSPVGRRAFAALERFLDHVLAHEHVWICRRIRDRAALDRERIRSARSKRPRHDRNRRTQCRLACWIRCVAGRGIFERSPWVAEVAVAARPFHSREDLHAALCHGRELGNVGGATGADSRAPGWPAAPRSRRADGNESAHEQHGAGLDACARRLERLQQLNTAYNARFGFPFVLAVRAVTIARRSSARFPQRLDNDPEIERREALTQIGRIAAFRLGRADSRRARSADHGDARAPRRVQRGSSQSHLQLSAPRASPDGSDDPRLDARRRAGTHVDAVGNVVGRWRSGNAGTKVLVTGSHYDTVIDARLYDGRLGVLLPIACALEMRASAASR